MNKEVFFKSLLTGIIYAIITCIVQVPIANVLFSLLKLQPETSISSERVPLLLLSILVVGIAMAIYFYRNGHLFLTNSKFKQGFKFALFIYLSNYIPQVFFLDANKGFSALITGGFPVFQVEIFDLIILVITVLLMITYMPCRYEIKHKKERNIAIWWKSILCGIIFAIILIVLQELLLPLLEIQSMATGLNVSRDNKLFFYIVMFVGFVLAGSLVSHRAFTLKCRNFFCLEYGVLIWCAFDLTMIPLGFGIIPTLAFMATSIIAFAGMECLSKSIVKKSEKSA
ncbi:MAG: hypothetical protein K2N06_05120 [Oscillospiraceae bacterium]|nr:hypothetical protein [Oscillospiraceae bacterium]